MGELTRAQRQVLMARASKILQQEGMLAIGWSEPDRIVAVHASGIAQSPREDADPEGTEAWSKIMLSCLKIADSAGGTVRISIPNQITIHAIPTQTPSMSCAVVNTHAHPVSKSTKRTVLRFAKLIESTIT